MRASEPEWWEDFFHGIALDLWRQAVTEDQTRNEADFLQNTLHLSPPARILDAPCGNGRLSFELANRGFHLTGVDIAQEFIEEANLKARGRDLHTTWENRDMRELSWENEFAGAFCFGNSFGYFSDAGNLNFLKSVGRSLEDKGKFILETHMCAESFFPKFQEHLSVHVGDIELTVENDYDHLTGRLNTDYTFKRGANIERRSGFHRIYTYRELCQLLEVAGLTVEQGYGSLKGEAFKLGSPLLLLVCENKR